MKRLMMALSVSAALGLALPAAAQMTSMNAPTGPLSKEGYATAMKNADAQYKIDKEACASLSGNAKDICIAEAKGKEATAKADAKAAHENTPKARESARVAHATATHSVALERCDDLAGNRKDVCVKEAKAALVRAKADAKVDRVAADTRKDATVKREDARVDANTAKRDADYNVAIEKCDALAGTAKDACVSSAKAKFGKN